MVLTFSDRPSVSDGVYYDLTLQQHFLLDKSQSSCILHFSRMTRWQTPVNVQHFWSFIAHIRLWYLSAWRTFSRRTSPRIHWLISIEPSRLSLISDGRVSVLCLVLYKSIQHKVGTIYQHANPLSLRTLLLVRVTLQIFTFWLLLIQDDLLQQWPYVRPINKLVSPEISSLSSIPRLMNR